MIDNAQADTDTQSDADPPALETSTSIVETPVRKEETKKAERGARTAKAAKAPKPVKSARARKAGKSEETVAPEREEAVEAVAKPATKPRLAKLAKLAEPVKGAAIARLPARTSKRAKPRKPTEVAKAVKSAKKAKPAVKRSKATPATAPAQTAKTPTGGSSNGVRYSTNELNSAAKKAGLTVEFTPVVTKAAHIARGPAKEFKVDAIIARLLGSNGDPIRDRGPGTPLYNDAESLAAVAIFEKFRGRTFHNKLKVEIL